MMICTFVSKYTLTTGRLALDASTIAEWGGDQAWMHETNATRS